MRLAGTDPSVLAPDELASGFMAASRTLWCVAAAVLGRREGADDVLQDAVMIALEKRTSFDRDTNLVAWLAKIVRYVALNHARRRQRSPIDATDPHVLAANTAPEMTTASPADAVTSRGTLHDDQPAFDDRTARALATLAEDQRACLLLRVTLDLPYREIGRILDLPEGTAMSHVHRARAALRSVLTASPDAPEAGA